MSPVRRQCENKALTYEFYVPLDTLPLVTLLETSLSRQSLALVLVTKIDSKIRKRINIKTKKQ